MGEGGVGPLKALFNTKKKTKKKKRRAFISFYFNIYFNRSFFHPRYFISLFFSSSQVHFPCKYFSFCLFLCCFFPPYHTSHSESLDVTDRMDVPVSTLSVILETLVVGLAAVEGDSAEL